MIQSNQRLKMSELARPSRYTQGSNLLIPSKIVIDIIFLHISIEKLVQMLAWPFKSTCGSSPQNHMPRRIPEQIWFIQLERNCSS
ncbi:MAG: hypothetical protein ACI8V0_000856 [Pseudohongiellaceae bacterium]|jgi:hypothetical protein